MQTGLAAALAIAVLDAAAQTTAYPVKPIRMIVASGAGGGLDFVARLVATPLTEALGQSVVVDNRAGASGSIAAELTSHSAPDGYTLMMLSASLVVYGIVTQTPYDLFRDFDPISLVSAGPYILTVHPSLPVNSVKDLIAYAKANPGQVSYGASGLGSTYHLGTELFAVRAGIVLTHVPYKGAGPAAQDLLAGHIQMMMETLYNALPSIRAGRLKALGIASASRNPSLPDVRTFSEQGLSNCEFSNWTGLFLPARASNALIGELNASLNKVLSHPDVKERFLKLGLQPAPGTPEDLAATVRTDIARWRETVRLARIKAE